MTLARIQPCLRKLDVNLGYFHGREIRSRNITENNIALRLYNNRFCLIWKSEGVSFNKAIEELERNFEKFDNFIAEENVKSHFEFI